MSAAVPARPPRPGPSRSLSLAAGGDVGSCLGTAGTGGRRSPSPGTVPVGKAGGAETRLGEQAHARVGEDQAGRSGSSPEPPMSHPHPPMTNRRDVSLDTEKKPGGGSLGPSGAAPGSPGTQLSAALPEAMSVTSRPRGPLSTPSYVVLKRGRRGLYAVQGRWAGVTVSPREAGVRRAQSAGPAGTRWPCRPPRPALPGEPAARAGRRARCPDRDVFSLFSDRLELIESDASPPAVMMPSQGTCCSVQRHLWSSQLWAQCWHLAEAGDADKHPAVHGTAPRRAFPARDVNGTEAVTLASEHAACRHVTALSSEVCSLLALQES